ncbi:hypothetical protein PENTCL1PPCAC_21594, partial [Pristionchus entomophagus]
LACVEEIRATSSELLESFVFVIFLECLDEASWFFAGIHFHRGGLFSDVVNHLQKLLPLLAPEVADYRQMTE